MDHNARLARNRRVKIARYEDGMVADQVEKPLSLIARKKRTEVLQCAPGADQESVHELKSVAAGFMCSMRIACNWFDREFGVLRPNQCSFPGRGGV